MNEIALVNSNLKTPKGKAQGLKPKQLKKDTKEELKIIERSFKRTTSPDCPYEVSDGTSKKFLKIKEKCNLIERIVLEAEINDFQDGFFDHDVTRKWPGTIERQIFEPGNDARRIFNQILFKLYTKKNPRVVVLKAIKKIEGLKKKVKKSFKEISARQEFYFDKITAQIVDQYKKSLKPYEFETLKLLFEFQDNLRLFNWNVVDKEAQIEFLFQIVQLLHVKQNLVEIPKAAIPDTIQYACKEISRSSGDLHPILFELLNIAETLRSLQISLKRLEQKLFTGENAHALTKKGKAKKLLPEQEKLLTRYLKQLYKLNGTMRRYKELVTNQEFDESDERISKLDNELKQHIEHLIAQKLPKLDSQEETEYENEFFLVKFITKIFGKIFFMLKRKRTMSDFYVIKRLLSEIVQKEKVKLSILIAVVFFNAVVGIIMPLVFQYLINYGLGDITKTGADPTVIVNIGFFFLAISIGGMFFSIISNYLVQFLANKSMYSMRERMFQNLQLLSFDYYNSQPSGKIISYITNDVETIQQLVSTGFLTIFVSVFSLVGSVVFMFLISWQLFLVAFSIIPLLLILGSVVFGKARQYFVITRNKIAAVTSHTQESVAGMRVIQAFAIEKKDTTTFDRACKEELEINLKSAKLFSALPGGIIAVISTGMMALIIVGGLLYIDFLLYPATAYVFTRGSLLAFILYVVQFFSPVIQIMGFVSQLQNAMAAGERIIRLIDSKSSVQERSHSIDVDSPEFQTLNKDNIRLKFENVSFEYEKGIQVLRNISLRAIPKERLAIVGYTGAGKTTFISLLSRFWDPTSGRILINDIDIRQFKLDALRKLMGIVLQDNYLFSGSVMQNIKYGKPSATDDEVYAITSKLGIHDFIQNMEKGYDTPVRERGSRLSIGQKQMIAFARALLVDPPILILDEATSAIDPYSEIIVKNALDVLLKDRTSITIAHRLSTIINSDRILVIDDGRIVEEGSHDELIAKGGLYNHLYELQYARLKKGDESEVIAGTSPESELATISAEDHGIDPVLPSNDDPVEGDEIAFPTETKKRSLIGTLGKSRRGRGKSKGKKD
ncbi:MAG TPA: ABC transporter transmembrane domain-containing protein [Candidatus Lokiarchaeia archaeon]|nr:ABC transporter transmembrane domain-containing protein [Candidatus Lokiarchaeia archaeon]